MLPGEDATRVSPKAGGYDEVLDGYDPAVLGFPVRLRELDTTDPATAHSLLIDIMAGKKTGVFTMDVHYTGKNPTRWIRHVAPPVLEPRHFGLFSPAGQLLGWISLMGMFTLKDIAQLGIVIRPEWTGKGLGTAVVRHVLKEKDKLNHKPTTTIFVATRPDNAPMVHILQQNGAFLNNGTVIDGDVPKYMFATQRVTILATTTQ